MQDSRTDQRPTPLDGPSDALLPKGAVDRDRLAGMEDLDADRRVRVPHADRREVALIVEDHGEVTGGTLMRHRGDRLVVDPRVIPANMAVGILAHPHGHTFLAWLREGGKVDGHVTTLFRVCPRAERWTCVDRSNER